MAGKFRLKMKPKALDKEVQRVGRRGIIKSIDFLEREIKLAMKSTPRLVESKSKRGKGRGKRAKFHHPSAPGHPPAVDRGRLIGAISQGFSWKQVPRRPRGKTKASDLVRNPVAKRGHDIGVVGTHVEYMIPLEYGTAKIPARPVWRPVFAKSRAKLATFFRPGPGR